MNASNFADMKVTIHLNNKEFNADLRQGIDCSAPINEGKDNLNAYHINDPQFAPFKMGTFVGDVSQGGACNCEDITFNPHGNATHTECIGHITSERITINQSLNQFHFVAQLISVEPISSGNDLIVTPDCLDEVIPGVQALCLRTLPNPENKKQRRYSGTNPTYLAPETAKGICDRHIDHVLIDLPSIDKEEDGGKLLAHRAFWNYPEHPREGSTITELAYFPDNALDGLYLLNIQIASFETDASPSKPVLYPLT
jgi:kynurenine formamidase